MPSSVTIFTGVIITILWAAAVVVGMFTADYMALQLTTPVMLAFAGYLFGDAIMKAKKSNG